MPAGTDANGRQPGDEDFDPSTYQRPAGVAANPPRTVANAPGSPAAPTAPAAPPTRAQSAADAAAARAAHQPEADRIGATGVLGTITDPHAAENAALLSRLKDGMNGMNAQENQAAVEQGHANVSHEMAQNLENYASHAGGQGVRGAANAALQGRAYNQANQQTADFSRQLILDNIALKGQGADRYAGALNNVDNRDLGIETANNDLRNKEYDIRTTLPGQLASADDARYATDMSNYLGGKGIDAANASIAALSKPAGTPAPGTPSAGAGTATYNDGTTKILASGAANPTIGKTNYTRQDGESNQDVVSRVSSDIKTNYQAAHPGANADEVNSAVTNGSLAWLNAHPEFKTSPKHGKIICTEAYRQGLISTEQWEVTGRYRHLLSIREYKGYLTWARPVVARMKAHPEFACRLLPFISRMIEAERYALGEVPTLSLDGRAVGALVKVLNYGAAFVRSLGLKLAEALDNA